MPPLIPKLNLSDWYPKSLLSGQTPYAPATTYDPTPDTSGPSWAYGGTFGNPPSWAYGGTFGTTGSTGVGGTAAGSSGQATGGGTGKVTTKASSPFDQLITSARASLLTPGGAAGRARAQTDAQIKAALGALNISSAREQQQYKDLQNRAAGFALALGNLGQQGAPAVGEAYNQAAGMLGALGTGLTGAVAADEQQYADQARAQVSQALGGLGQVGGYDIPGLQSTSQYTGVTLPARSLGEQAGLAVQQANADALAAAGSVAGIEKDYETKAVDALRQREADRAAIAAKRPELYQEALDANRKDRINTLSTLATLQTAKANWGIAQAKAKTAAQTARADARLKTIALTHIDPVTKQPVGGWMRDPTTGGLITTANWLANQTALTGLKSKESIAGATLKEHAAESAASIASRENIAQWIIKGQNARANQSADLRIKIANQQDATRRWSVITNNAARMDVAKLKQAGLDARGGASAATWGTWVNRASSLVGNAWKNIPAKKDSYGKDIAGTEKARVPYMQALSQAYALGPATPAWAAKVKQITDAKYGTPTAIATKVAQRFKVPGSGLNDAIRGILQSQMDGSADLPMDQYVASLARVFGAKREAVRAQIQQMAYLMSTGQPGGQ